MEKTKAEQKQQIYLDLKAKRKTLGSISPKLSIYLKIKREVVELEKKYNKL